MKQKSGASPPEDAQEFASSASEGVQAEASGCAQAAAERQRIELLPPRAFGLSGERASRA